MKALIFCALLLSLPAYAATPADQEKLAPGLADGVWVGTMRSETITADDVQREERWQLMMASCGGAVRFWANSGDGVYVKLGEKYGVHSQPSSHLVYFMDADPKQPGWVEFHTYTVLELDAERAAVQWNRTVNNRDKEVSHANRYFYSRGAALLRRDRAGCETQLVHAPKEVAAADDIHPFGPTPELTAALWGATDPAVFRFSSFSAAEISTLLGRTAFRRHLMLLSGKGRALETCSSLKVLATRPLPKRKDGAKREIWDIDACSFNSTMTMELSAEEQREQQ